MRDSDMIARLIENYPELFSAPHGYGECAECGGIGNLIYVNNAGYDIHPHCLLSDSGILPDERSAYATMLQSAR